VVDPDALAEAIEGGHLAGAELDVMSSEPPSPDDRLLSLRRVTVTPHAAFFSAESTINLQRGAATSALDVLCGRPPAHIVSPDVLTSPALRAKALRDPPAER
jgi:D-3-phosphoglycerate dehydrogenase